jgi:hypothetical protein
VPILRFVPLFLIVTVALATRGEPIPRSPSMTPDDPRLAAMVAEHRRAEPILRDRARRAFNDAWSRGDDFTNAERRLVREQSAQHGVAVSSILLGIDADVRATRATSPERGAVPPCAPRPFYD